MRKRDVRALGGVLLALLAVGIAAWFLGGFDERKSSTPATAADAAASGEAASKSRIGVGAELPAPRALEAGPSQTLPAEPAAQPGEALSFTGRVIDEAGTPIAGALVLHWPTAAFRQEANLPRDVHWESVPWARLDSTHTDVDGHFQLDSRDVSPERISRISVSGVTWDRTVLLGEQEPRLLVEHTGFGTEEILVPATRAGSADVGDIVLRAGVDLTGRLVDENGEGVADVALSVRGAGRLGRYVQAPLQQLRLGTVSDATGHFRIPGLSVEPWKLHAEPTGFTPFERDLPTERAGPVDVGDIELDRGTAIAGHVVNEQGKPVAGAEVVVRMMVDMDGVDGPDRAAAAWDNRINAGGTIFEPCVRTDADGAFVVSGLWPAVNTFRVTARAPGLDPATQESVKPGARHVWLALTPAASWRIDIVDALDAAPVAAATLKAERLVEGSFDGLSSAIDAVQDDAGWLLSGASRWRTRVTVSAPGYAPTTFDLDGLGAGEFRQQTLPLPRELVVVGRVVDDKAEPLAGARVEVRPAAYDSELQSQTTITADDGGIRLQQLAPGEWWCTASAAGHVALLRPRVLTLLADQTPPPIELELPAGGDIQGVLQDAAGQPLPREWVSLKTVDPSAFAGLTRTSGEATDALTSVPDLLDAWTVTLADGSFVFDCLPPGTWTLDARDGAQADVKVVARESSMVTLVRRPRPGVEGRVMSGGLPVEGATVELSPPRDAGSYVMESTSTDVAGHFLLETPEACDYFLFARDADVVAGPVPVTTRWNERTLADISFGASRLAGRVTLEGAGTPLKDVEVSLMTVKAADWGYDPHQRLTHSDAEGHFTFERVQAGTWTLVASGEKLMEKRADVQVVDSEPTTSIDLALTRGSTIEVELQGFVDDGQQVFVWLLPPDDPARLLSELCRPNGRVTFPPVAGGDYELSVRQHDGKKWIVLHSEHVMVVSGQDASLRVHGN